MNYTGSGSPKSINVASGAFTLTGLPAGAYSGFSVTTGGCTGIDNTSKTLTDPNCTSIIYVNAANTNPTQNGQSWATAFSSLQAGLSAAALPSVVSVEVWVANGTYKPGTTRQSYFMIPSGVKVYGGFIGTETQLTQRILTPPSGGQMGLAGGAILSGEIGTSASNDNVHHVVVFSGTNANTLLDGFTITRGHAQFVSTQAIDPTEIFHWGGGVSTQNKAEGHLTNCNITGNKATNGGGIYQNDSCSVMVSNSAIWGNEGTFGGGIHQRGFTSSIYTNCLIVNNRGLGGGVNLNNSRVSFMNCVISNNNGLDGTPGAIWHVNGSAPVITNSIVWGNSNVQINKGALVNYSIVQGGYLGVANLSSGPKFVNQNDWNAAPNGTMGDYRLLACSPALNVGTSVGAPALDLLGNARPQGGGVDMGAYEGSGVVLPNTLNISNNISSGSSSFTAGTITATNQVSNATVTYTAGQSVTLLPGFKAEGTVFTAQIGVGCN
ncbi:MAG: right-handed parallel beta-helix repeat-containing protein [Runella slithyformis]|nr:MAG: right-handed parallel beta-helix repeat-containing protein [Runella slithyformis]